MKTIKLVILFIALGYMVNAQIENNDLTTNNIHLKNTRSIEFPIGYHKFCKDKAFNFQMNRFYTMGYARFEDMEESGKRIASLEDWKIEMIKLAEHSISEDRFLNAAFYYRAAEFFITEEDPEKELLYKKFIEYFKKATVNDNLEYTKIPFNQSFIYAIRLQPESSKKNGTIVLHGGFDSFKEELYSIMLYFYHQNYEVITFETPWMGESRKHKEMGLNIVWEEQISSILDHYELGDVTLIGVSMGGWLSLRAAAFEPRVTRVIASSVSFDVNQYNGKMAQKMAKLFFTKWRNFTNRSLEKKMKKDQSYAWFVNHLMFTTNKKTPVEAFDVLMQFNEENLHSELVKQDVMILTGKQDHAIPFKMHQMQVDALINAKSITDKVYTKETTGEHHCQVGNIKMSLDDMLEWIEMKSQNY